MGDSAVVRSLDSLPARFRGEDTDLAARFRIEIGRAVRDIVVSNGRCTVDRANGARPDVVIKTDPGTWLEIDEGRLSGIEAFATGKLNVRGSIERSLMFEPLFEHPSAGALEYSVEMIGHRGNRISALVAGDEAAEPVVMLHGLGGTKSSWLPIVPALARRHRVIALDLPGFGSSSKPRGRYDARWFSRRVFSFLDEMDVDAAFVAGNSMGGRIAMEMAMTNPARVRAIACLCPATAFSKRPGLWLVKLLRPELAFAASRLPRSYVLDGLKQLFADPARVEDEWFEAAVDDFLTIWRSPRARMAFSAAARHIYMEEPTGETGFWARLAAMDPPALYLYGTRDVLINHHSSRGVRKALPGCEVVVWQDSGHVPQIEHPERTSSTILGFFERATAELKVG
ncbi:MAG TPA: alpha/beta fold hydrolase [Actinomycetota bacterium]|nr:alpha/beta fold hydrolase [Actinomycetota bacterium]